MRVFLIVLFGLALLLGGGVLLGPRLIEPSAYKRDIAERLEAATGGDVAIAGDVAVTPLPRPALTLKDVRLSARVFGDSGARIGVLRVELRPGALLRGEVRVARAVLREPEIALADVGAGTGTGTETESGGDWRRRLARLGDLGLERVRIEDGTVRLPAGVRRAGLPDLTALAADIRLAGGVAGPVRADGAVRLGSRDLSFRARLGRRDNGAAAYALDLRDAAETLRVALSGQLQVAGPFQAAGEARIEASGPGVLPPGPARWLAVRLGIPDAGRFMMEGQTHLDAKALTLSNLDLRAGAVAAKGALGLRFARDPAVRVDLRADQVDLDRMLAAIPADRTQRSASSGGRLPAGWRLPTGWRGEIVLDAAALVYRGRVVRDARLRADLAGGVLTVADLAARFPGSSRADLSGRIVMADGRPRFEGDFDVAADNLRTVFDWLGVAIDAVPRARLRRLAGTGQVRLQPGRARFTNLDMTLDTVAIAGGVAAALRARPGLGIGLRIDRLDLDAYMPPAGAGAGEGGVAREMGAALAALLNRFDANLDLRVGTLIAGGRTAKDVRLDATLDQGDLTLRNLRAARVGGGVLNLDGEIADVTGARPNLDLRLAWDGGRAADLARMLGFDAAWPSRLGRVDLSGALAGTRGDLTVDLTLRALGGVVQGRGRIAAAAQSGPRVDLDTTFTHDNLRALLDAAAGMSRSDRGEGGVNLSARIEGDRESLVAEGFGGKIGSSQVSGRIAARFTGARPHLNLRLDTGTIPLPDFLGGSTPGTRTKAGGGAPWRSMPFDLAVLESVDADIALDSSAVLLGAGMRLTGARLRAALDGGALRVADLSGAFLDGTAEAELTLDSRETPAMDLALDLRGVAPGRLPAPLRRGLGLDLDLGLDLGGTLNGTVSARARGVSEAAMIASLTGDARVSGNLRVARAEDSEVGLLRHVLGARVAEMPRLAEAEARLHEAFGRAPHALSGRVTAESGTLRTADLRWDGDGLTAAARGAVDLDDWRVDGRLVLARDDRPGGLAIETGGGAFVTRLTGRLGAPRLRLDGGPADVLAAPAASGPDAPQIQAPELQTPTVETPAVEKPEIETPQTPSPTVQPPATATPERPTIQRGGAGAESRASNGRATADEAGADAPRERGGVRSADEIIEELLKERLGP